MVHPSAHDPPHTSRPRVPLRRSALRRQQTRAGYAFVLPSLAVLLVFVYWPIVQALLLSVQQWRFGASVQPFVGLANYARLLRDARAWQAFSNTLTYTIVVVPVGMALALALALALNTRLPGRALLRAAFFLPVIASFAIIAIVWSFLLNPEIGVFSYWAERLGLPPTNWLRDARFALWAVILVSLWKTVGFNMVIFLAGLQGIAPSLYEAATLDGAGRWQRFWFVTLPLLRPTTLFVLVISIIAAFQVFDQSYVLTPKGGPLFSTETVVTYIYYQGVTLIDISYAAAIGVVLFAIVLALTIVQLRLLRFRDVD